MKSIYKTILPFLVLFIGISLLNSCSTGKTYIDKTETFSIKDKTVKHIISINPNFILPATLNPEIAKNKPIINRQEVLWFYKILQENAKVHGIHLQIEGAAETIEGFDSNYFNYLAPLKREILQVLYLQDFADVNKKESSTKMIQEYKNGLVISSHYSHLAEKYGTPYFALQGISYIPKTDESKGEVILAAAVPTNDLSFITSDVETVYYTVIVDVSLSEIVYKEFRIIKTNNLQKNFDSIVDDSFSLISK
ncbi:MAG: hypothetical protein ACI97N_001124 [Cognaticolwellia sp.]|jgi:hypothetical protein